MIIALAIYGALGLATGTWFYRKMSLWARVGGQRGRRRLWLLTPLAALLWPATVWMLLQ